MLTALQLPADRLPAPRADGDREALRILLTARTELTTTTAQTNRLRALLLGGDDTDRQLARSSLTEAILTGLIQRRGPRQASREQSTRQAEIKRLALALREGRHGLRANRGGDRALNRALHTIALTRIRSCPTTRTYVAKRTTEGKTPREIRRCLKRYIARQLYRTLTTAMTP